MTVERRLAHASAMIEAVLCSASPAGVIDASAYPTATFGPAHDLELTNPAFRALFGTRSLEPLVPYLEAVRARDTVHVATLALGSIDCAVTVRAVRGTGAIVVCEVITEERAEVLARALADAELANLRKDQFLAAVSHELRTPVTTMLLWDKVLRDATSDAPLRAQALDAIHDSAIAQARLVGDLLDIARAISGKLHIDLRAIDIHRIVAEAVSGIASTAAARGIAIEAPATAVVLVEGDAFRVRQILDNLLSNALKFTERGGRITVAVTSKARAVTIQVVDNGRGIAAEFLQQIFEPFSQSEVGAGAGLGLGLAISKQLVELQHGMLAATSPGLGQGSTFSVTLPAAGRERSPAIAPSVATLPHRLVVVDDDRRVLDALSLLLERVGATVVTAASAEDARRAIAEATPELVLCDIAMPGEDGYTLIAGLRAAGVRVPAIALTAHAMEADAARAIAAGFDAHVAKPIDFERLVAKIAQLIAERP